MNLHVAAPAKCRAKRVRSSLLLVSLQLLKAIYVVRSVKPLPEGSM